MFYWTGSVCWCVSVVLYISSFQGHFAKQKRLIWVSRFPSESSLYHNLLPFGQSSRCIPWHNVWHMGIKGENATALQQNTKYFSSFHRQITAQANNDENMTHSLRNSQIAHFPSSYCSRIKLINSVTAKLENCNKEFDKNRCEIQKRQVLIFQTEFGRFPQKLRVPYNQPLPKWQNCKQEFSCKNSQFASKMGTGSPPST